MSDQDQTAPLSAWARSHLEQADAGDLANRLEYVQACALVSIAESSERIANLLGTLEPLAMFVPTLVQVIRAETESDEFAEDLGAVMGRHFTEWDSFDPEHRYALITDLRNAMGVPAPEPAT